MDLVRPKYPIYIVSKGRYAPRLTVRALEYMRVPYKIIIEEQEFSKYAEVIARENILVLDKKFQHDYDPCDEFGLERSKGSGPARNFAWEHARLLGAKRHWVMDDNIDLFFRYNKNMKIPVTDGTVIRCMEDFCDRYQNVAMAGPNYFKFVARKSGTIPPFVLNTRIYSCNLILTALPFRWRARYNEDVDLSLRLLKGGWCTILFNAFLQDKQTTQRSKGGNTDELYAKGTTEKSTMLARLHPAEARVVWRFSRVHHFVDYRKFRQNKLKASEGLCVAEGVNDYGMRRADLRDGQSRYSYPR